MTEHLKVKRWDGGDAISWDVLQAIKDEMLGKHVVAIEVYPAEYDVVNEANIRHLWAIPQHLAPNLAR